MDVYDGFNWRGPYEPESIAYQEVVSNCKKLRNKNRNAWDTGKEKLSPEQKAEKKLRKLKERCKRRHERLFPTPDKVDSNTEMREEFNRIRREREKEKQRKETEPFREAARLDRKKEIEAYKQRRKKEKEDAELGELGEFMEGLFDFDVV